MINPMSSSVKNTLKYVASTEGNNKLPTAPIPAMSAPMLSTMAGKLNSNIRYNTGLG